MQVSHAFQATDLLPVVEAEPSILFTEPSVFSKGVSHQSCQTSAMHVACTSLQTLATQHEDYTLTSS
jgi:hypothetical protein